MKRIIPHNPLEGPAPELTIPLYNTEEDLISIVIVHKDTPEYLSLCLQSIAVASIGSNYEIIIVDNASGKDTQDYLDELPPDVKVIRNNRNLYWSAAANQGAAHASKHSKYIIFMHADTTIIHAGWMDLLVSVAESEESGMVGAATHMYRLGKQDIVFVQEWLVMLSRECFEAIGPWPEELPMVGHAFMLTIKAVQNGFKPQGIMTQIAHHWKAFSVNINEYEVMVDEAMAKIPKMVRTVQTQPAGLARV